jgi:hypothetical protein
MEKIPVENWLIPKLWNQGGYDFINLETGSRLLQVIQVTRRKSHDYKLHYVETLLETLREIDCRVSHLDVVFVYPKNEECPSCSDV